MRKIILSLAVFIFSVVTVMGQADSLGIKKEGDKIFVMHKVIAGQTLYSLSRRYGTSVTDIKNKNAELENGLQVGQTILIPYTKAIIATPIKTNGTHVVKTGETLFSISRQYNVNIEDIKKLNGMTTNELSIGQVLKIAVAVNSPIAIDENQAEKKTADVVKKEVAEPIKAKTEGETSQVNNDVKKAEVKVDEAKEEMKDDTSAESFDAKPFEEIIEEGQAELIVEDESSTKFLALHKTAKVGTVIKVKNRMNNLTVYVRVVGEIPKTTDNENIIIKINKRAYDQLKALDTRFLVELSYFK